jgi:hypothetical protein
MAKLNIIPGIIYGWKKLNDMLKYDKIHRYIAGCEIGTSVIITSTMITVNELMIIDDFKNINKSINYYTNYIFKKKMNIKKDKFMRKC